MKKILTLMFIILSQYSLAHDDEDEWVDLTTWNIVEKDFWELIDVVHKIYQPIFSSLRLENDEAVSWWIEADWSAKDRTLKARKEKVYPYGWNRWTVKVNGGIARDIRMTKEGFILGLCHEIGHLLGGYPFIDEDTSERKYSTEGQADYYATYVCARKVFSQYKPKRKGEDNAICKKNFDTKEERSICNYSVIGATSLANLFYYGNKADDSYKESKPTIATPDSYVAKVTYEYHNTSQCRLDTFVAGIMCDKFWDDGRIPKERNAVCRNRPACWYYD